MLQCGWKCYHLFRWDEFASQVVDVRRLVLCQEDQTAPSLAHPGSPFPRGVTTQRRAQATHTHTHAHTHTRARTHIQLAKGRKKKKDTAKERDALPTRQRVREGEMIPTRQQTVREGDRHSQAKMRHAVLPIRWVNAAGSWGASH